MKEKSSPFPRRIETSRNQCYTAISRFESALKKPTVIYLGQSPTGTSFAAAPNVPSPFPRWMETSSSFWLTTARSKKSVGGVGGVGGVGVTLNSLSLLFTHTNEKTKRNGLNILRMV